MTIDKNDLPREHEGRHEYCARMNAKRERELGEMDPLARNIARVDAELERRMNTMKHNCFAKPENAIIVRELSQALATMVEMQTLLGDDDDRQG